MLVDFSIYACYMILAPRTHKDCIIYFHGCTTGPPGRLRHAIICGRHTLDLYLGEEYSGTKNKHFLGIMHVQVHTVSVTVFRSTNNEHSVKVSILGTF